MLWTPNCTNVVVPLASAHIKLFSLFRPLRKGGSAAPEFISPATREV